MDNLYDHISSNKRKSVLLIFLFFIILCALGYSFGVYFGDYFIGIYIGAAASIIIILVGYFAGDSIILGMSHSAQADKSKYPHLVNAIEGLAIGAGIPTPKIYIIDDSAINAFATGRDPKHASVTVTTGAIQRLKRDELEGVLAHEIAHIRNYDIRMMMFVVVLVASIALLSDIFLRSVFYGRGRRNSNSRGSGAVMLVVAVLGVALAILAPLIAQLIKLAVSRKREFLADADGALICRHPKGLAGALKKIRDDKEPLVEAANKATAHLFIENPLRTFGGRINGMFSTHPPIDERIKRLENF